MSMKISSAFHVSLRGGIPMTEIDDLLVKTKAMSSNCTIDLSILSEDVEQSAVVDDNKITSVSVVFTKISRLPNLTTRCADCALNVIPLGDSPSVGSLSSVLTKYNTFRKRHLALTGVTLLDFPTQSQEGEVVEFETVTLNQCRLEYMARFKFTAKKLTISINDFDLFEEFDFPNVTNLTVINPINDFDLLDAFDPPEGTNLIVENPVEAPLAESPARWVEFVRIDDFPSIKHLKFKGGSSETPIHDSFSILKNAPVLHQLESLYIRFRSKPSPNDHCINDKILHETAKNSPNLQQLNIYLDTDESPVFSYQKDNH